MGCTCKKRNIILLSKALDQNLLFIPQRTIYRWIKERKNSEVFFKVLGRVAVDMDEYYRLIEKAKDSRPRRNKRSKQHECSCARESLNLAD